MARLRQDWVNGVNLAIEEPTFSITLSCTIAKQHVVKRLADRNFTYAIHQMGCGVTKITRDTSFARCPCCKRATVAGA